MDSQTCSPKHSCSVFDPYAKTTTRTGVIAKSPRRTLFDIRVDEIIRKRMGDRTLYGQEFGPSAA